MRCMSCSREPRQRGSGYEMYESLKRVIQSGLPVLRVVMRRADIYVQDQLTMALCMVLLLACERLSP